ncbi:MAG: zinc ribbon domain-containing protein [Blastochloris sp.]|nr:zinc ribbon domain-containing protein [Blastochloris sp.]
MPLYQYELVEGQDPCKVCGGSFELRRPADRPALTQCPICRKAVRKCISQIHTPKVLKPFSVVDAKKAGFKVLKRRDVGTYESL